MKWDCGKKKREREQWHRWFAWYPVRLADNDCRWLEYVERKGELDDGWWWEYR